MPKSIHEVHDLSNQKGVDLTGVEYFIEDPSQLSAFIKEYFQHAEEYFDKDTGLTSEEINKMVETARKKNAENKFSHYTFVADIINILLDTFYSTAAPPKMQKDTKTNREKLMILFPHLKEGWEEQAGKRTYRYYYNVDPVISFQKPVTLESISNVNEKSLIGYYSNKINTAYDDLRSKTYVKEHMAKMIIDFLGKIYKENPLDFEFVGRRFSTNTVFQDLTHRGYYNIVAALLKTISPNVATEQLKLTIKITKKTVLQTLIENLPTSTGAVTEVINLLQELEWKNPADFQSFIKANSGITLSLRESAGDKSELLQKFLAINPEVILKQSRSAVGGLTMPGKNPNPSSVKASAPPPLSSSSYPKIPKWVITNNSSSSSETVDVVAPQFVLPPPYANPNNIIVIQEAPPAVVANKPVDEKKITVEDNSDTPVEPKTYREQRRSNQNTDENVDENFSSKNKSSGVGNPYLSMYASLSHREDQHAEHLEHIGCSIS